MIYPADNTVLCCAEQVAENVTALGTESWPLLSSWPHPEEFMQWMREAFAQPEVFTAQCVSEAKKYNYTGYNLDWEPTDGVYACLCVCVSVYMTLCVCMCMCMCIHASLCVHVHMYVYLYVHVYVYSCTWYILILHCRVIPCHAMLCRVLM